MRIVAEIPHSYMKISVFSWQGKYTIKFELGQYEQVFKISESDVGGIEELKKIVHDDFLEQVHIRFSEMSKDFKMAWDNRHQTS
jgi:hypothetical protein